MIFFSPVISGIGEGVFGWGRCISSPLIQEINNQRQPSQDMIVAIFRPPQSKKKSLLNPSLLYTRFLVFTCYEAHDICHRLLKNVIHISSPRKRKINNRATQPQIYHALFTLYMRKFRAARVQFDNHVVSGIAYGIAQTAVVCVVPPDIISITACP